MINCEIELDLLWQKECIISEISITPEVCGDNSVDVIQTTGATFQISNAKLFAPVVTLSINEYIKFLKNTKQGFKRTISCNKSKSEITSQPKSNNLDNLIFRNINRLLHAIATCHFR